jgi:ADP-ribose pyrophosphatase YjhB (NUDIX family)
MRFCSQCGSDRVAFEVPAGDSRPRHVCKACQAIHYQNPRVIAGCLVTHEDKVLLCRRAIEPRRGLWTIPAGFLENGETLAEGAARETWEEAAARVELDELYGVFNLTHIHQIYVFYRGRLVNGEYGVGEESLETRLFAEHEIPWEELAFPTVHKTLRYFFEDRRTGQYPVRVRDIPRRGRAAPPQVTG